MRNAVIIFTRVPVPGQTKTRMMPFLNGKECAKLHTCFLKDIENECRKIKADVFVCFTPEDKEGILHKILGKQEYFPQVGESLGDKMYFALEHVLKKGYDKCLLMGTDIPEIRAEYLTRAFGELNRKDIVFGRTEDGGYYLVGMKKPHREPFEISGYGHADVWKETLKHLEEAGLTVGFTKKLSDMDEPEDLRSYRERMRDKKELQDTTTGKYLMKTAKISVIIPIYNEEKTIQQMQRQLYPLKEKCEIIFVDGGSTDRTLEYLDADFKVIHSKKGRASQMNAGAKESTGDILFFLHCDSELPSHALAEIRYVMKDYRAGCFGIAFHSRSLLMHICALISNHRIIDRKVMFGDQGIFIDRDLFFEIGMYADMPILEDYRISLDLKERGVKLGIAKHRIYTSDRRFPKKVIPKLELMWKMNRLRKMYRDGVDIQKIAGLYRDVR